MKPPQTPFIGLRLGRAGPVRGPFGRRSIAQDSVLTKLKLDEKPEGTG